MNHKQSLLDVGEFYTAEEALTLLRNMSDFGDESASENEIESDSSDSSEYVPEQQHQVRTNSNIQTLLLKETVNQNATKCALLANETATTSGEEQVPSPPKYLKSMKCLQRVKKLHQNWLLKSVTPQKASGKGKKPAPKLVVNQNATKCALLVDETATTSGEEHVASPPKVSKVKKISGKDEKAAPKLVVNQNATKCALLADETATTSGEEHVASPPKIS